MNTDTGNTDRDRDIAPPTPKVAASRGSKQKLKSRREVERRRNREGRMEGQVHGVDEEQELAEQKVRVELAEQEARAELRARAEPTEQRSRAEQRARAEQKSTRV